MENNMQKIQFKRNLMKSIISALIISGVLLKQDSKLFIAVFIMAFVGCMIGSNFIDIICKYLELKKELKNGTRK